MRSNLLLAIFAGAIGIFASVDDHVKATSVLGEMLDYARGMTTNAPFMSAATFVATKPGVLEKVESWASSVDNVIMHTGTLKANFLEALPTEIRQVYSSYVNAQVSIASKGGIVIHIEGRTGAAPGSIAVHAAAAVVAGLLFVIAVL